jgi:uncharacterized protein
LKILIVADVESRYIWDFFQKDKFKDIDLIISCGDLRNEYLSFLVTMINAPLIYVPGNHNTRYLRETPEGCESIDDSIINFNGIRILGLGGSMRYNGREYQYTEKQMENRIKKLRFKLFLNHGFDILVTHAPAFGINDGEDLCHTGFKAFNDLIDKYKPKYLFHGHQHLSYGKTERIAYRGETTIVNAYEYYILEY